MRQTLFYIPETLFGFPVFGFGLALVALLLGVVIAAAWRFSHVKKVDGDLSSYLGLLVFGGAIIMFVVPNVLEPGLGFPIRGYGVFLLIAILSSIALVLYLAKFRGISTDTVFSLGLWAVVSGLLGARLFYITEYWSETAVYDTQQHLLIMQTLLNVVNIAKGGLVVYGSILGGMVGAITFMKLNRLPIFATLDLLAPAMFLGIAIGRLGCLMNGCCFGGVCELPWAITFPEGSPAHAHQIMHGDAFYYGLKFKEQGNRLEIEAVEPGSAADKAGLKPDMQVKGICGMVNGKPEGWAVQTPLGAFEVIHDLHHADPTGNIRFDVIADADKGTVDKYFVGPTASKVLPVHPTQIYSSIGAAIACGILLILRQLSFFRNRDGAILVSFLFLYSLGRFFIETIRTDEGSFLGTGFTVSQNVCFAVFLAAIVLSFVVFRTRNQNVAEANQR